MEKTKMAISLVTDTAYGAKIKVVGVGGAGGNAINNMIEKGLDSVDFIAMNTDIQDLERNKSDIKIQIGRNTTLGLGAGMDETKGAKAVEESREEIEQVVRGSDMVFITAGMGGGTGTGGAPAVARIAKATGALVVGIVTKPFDFEGDDRIRIAEDGLKRLKQEVDSCIVIPNERLLTLFGEEITLESSFKKVDDVLYNATRGISDIITKKGKVNVDFADVKTIMRDMGDALMGIGYAKGENKSLRATQEAIDNPLLEGVSIAGSKSILLNIIADPNFKISELKNMTEQIKQAAGCNYGKLIWGVVSDERLEDEIIVTIIATGFSIVQQKQLNTYPEKEEVKSKNLLLESDIESKVVKIPSTQQELQQYDIPAVQRNKLLSDEDIKKIRTRNEELELDDFDFDSDDFKISNDDKPAFLRRQMD
ncbi:MAG: cell division protein FtsZ [Chlorobi bacterium]|nr:cell division protein FtsZ [Chlorobiota bacterium]MCI0715074.1 cell division protein FtsZ [Chlorobiota bacterium]